MTEMQAKIREALRKKLVTGNPDKMAGHFGIAEPTAYNLMEDLADRGYLEGKLTDNPVNGERRKYIHFYSNDKT